MGARRFGIWFLAAASICTGGVPASPGATPLSTEEQACYADLDSRGLETFTNVDFASYLVLRHRVQLASGQLPNPAAEVGHYAMKAKGQQFRLNAVRFDWTEVDCVNLVHRSLAAALASDWASFRLISDRILHRGGIVDFRERNMSTLGEFLPNTRWLLTDVTGSLRAGDEPASDTFTFVVRPKVFVPHPSGDPRRWVFKGSDYSAAAQVITESYIPKTLIRDVLGGLRTGDVVLVLSKSSGGNLGCNHVGIVYVGPEEVSMIGGGPPVPLDGMAGYAATAGFKFLRLRPDARAVAAAESAAVSTQPAPPEEEDSRVVGYRTRRSKPTK